MAGKGVHYNEEKVYPHARVCTLPTRSLPARY
jgi:hypothetical protein